MTINLENWQAIGGAIGVLLIAAWGRIDSYKTKKAAKKAAELSAPTGNGFAKKVMDKLERLESGQVRNDKANARIEKKIDDHIAAHADAEIASRPRRILRDVNEL